MFGSDRIGGAESMSIPKNIQFLANAGSGKTHKLITRILTLLSGGKKPSSIIALTFTRNAAGEFLTKLLTRLEQACRSPEAAAKLSGETGIPRAPSDYLAMLREVIADLDKLQFTTLDGFFNMIAAAYPRELGLPGAPALIDPTEENLVADSVLRKALMKFRKEDPKGFAELTEAFLGIEEGSAKRSIADRLDEFRLSAHALILSYPDAGAWGDPERVWPGGCPFRKLTAHEKEAARRVVLAETGEPAFTPKARIAWDALAALSPGSKTNTITDRIMEDLDSWRAGTAELAYDRKVYQLPPATQQAAAALVGDYLHECTWMRLREAKAIHSLLDLYEQEYEREVRGRGKLSFTDITELLKPAEGFAGLGFKEDLNRLRIDERLDARHDHWLLDEFQDTSRSQYAVLENLLSEVISSPEDRSFFCVGDVKQAIYGWRNGEARLFDEIRRRYNEHLPAGTPEENMVLQRGVLAKSWRSSEHVLDFLNKVFGSLKELKGIPQSLRERWIPAWENHQAERPMDGFFRWDLAEGGDAEGKDDDIKEKVLTLLKGVRGKIEEGMTVALLVRSGDDARKWLEILAAGGVDAVSQSNPKAGMDNPLSAAVHSAIRLTAHPGDRFAKNHLSLHPLCTVPSWCEEGKFRESRFLDGAGRALADGGFTGLMEFLLAGFETLLQEDDAFGHERACSLRGIARKADASGIIDPDDFLRLMAEYEEKGVSSPNAVQVMTIHKSKGLEYDMVVIPFLGSQNALDTVKAGVIEVCNPTARFPVVREESFLMRLPADAIRKAPSNERLKQSDDVRRAERAYEELCTWYVAMSRAKHALHIFSHLPDPKDDKDPAADCPSVTLLMKWLLGDNRSWGNENWVADFHPTRAAADPAVLPPAIAVSERMSPLLKSRPSDEGHGRLPGAVVFAERDAAGLGIAVHSLFEETEWVDGKGIHPEHETVDQESLRLFSECMAVQEVRQLFTRPSGNPEVWRERRFDVTLDGRWISGCFDRVVIRREGDDVTKVDLIDFKTDTCGADELPKKYAGQIATYRKVLSRILSVDEKAVSSLLIHVRTGTVVPL
jgi:ATP-dependent helicase/nuclease subunit A